jgi:ATP-binding cassette, subfamily B, bacterial PglK
VPLDDEHACDVGPTSLPHESPTAIGGRQGREPTVLSLLRATFEILSPKYQRRVFFLVLGSVLSALIDAVAFGLLYPFIQLLTNPSPEYHSTALRVTSDLLGTSSRHTLEGRLGVLILILFVLSSVLGIALAYAQSRVVAKSEADVSIRLFTGYLHAPYAEHLDRNSSQLVQNVHNAVGDIHQLVLMSMLIITGNLVQVAIITAVMMVITPVVTCVAIAYFGLISVVYARVVSPRAERAGREYLEGSGQVIRISQEGFGGIKSLQAHDTLDPIGKEFERTKWAFARNRHAMVYYSQLPQYFLQSALIGGIVLFGVVIFVTNSGDVTALLGLLMAASLKMLPALYSTLSSLNRIRNGQGSLEVIQKDLDHQAEQAEREALIESEFDASVEPVALRDRIEFADVSFSYSPEDRPVMDHVSFVVPKGQSVAIVGPSGAGKTTAVDLLLGLFAATSGAIKIDDVVLGHGTVKQWRSTVGYVPQEVFLLDGSIADNIRFNRSDKPSSDPELWRALERAQIADFVVGLPEGIDTVVGERGVRLSGGQRQRLGIARALFRQPQVLILDEATSALDMATEAAVSETIVALRGTLTMVIIAHRLSTVRDCDSLVLLDHGKVVAVGDFDTLRRESTLFSELARLSHMEVSRS